MPDVASFKMAHLLAAYPDSHEVLLRHGLDSSAHCHHALRRSVTLGQALRRTCTVDDIDATLKDLATLINQN